MNELIEYNNLPVVTTEYLARFYNCSKDRIKMNFKRNKKRYIENRDYFILRGDALREFRKSKGEKLLLSPNTPCLYLWTEKGALNHAKSLNTDQAWGVYHNLLDTYFKVREMTQDQFNVLTLEEKTKYALRILDKKIKEIRATPI